MRSAEQEILLNGNRIEISCQYLHHSQQHLIYRYHIFMVSGQVDPIIDNCQIISVHRHL